jgi:hypothetical protein
MGQFAFLRRIGECENQRERFSLYAFGVAARNELVRKSSARHPRHLGWLLKSAMYGA